MPFYFVTLCKHAKEPKNGIQVDLCYYGNHFIT